MERSRPQVLVAVEPRLLGDSLSIALDRTGEWDIVQLADAAAGADPGVEAAIITGGAASGVRCDIVIGLPDESAPGNEGYIEIHGHRHPLALPTVEAIIDALRRAEDNLDDAGSDGR